MNIVIEEIFGKVKNVADAVSVTAQNSLRQALNVSPRAQAIVREVVDLTGNCAKKLYRRTVGTLQQATTSLTRIFAHPSEEFRHKKSFPERPVVGISDMFKRWNEEYVNFIRNQCMKRFEDCEGESITPIEDEDGVFIARSEYAPDITVDQAKRFGFILPEDVDERVNRNPSLRVRPLMIRCFGVGSGNTVDQIKAGVKNILSLSTSKVLRANTLIQSHIKSEQQRFESDENTLVIPFITGFSMGGMFANAIAIKNNYTSMVFNGLGLGEKNCKLVGKENWKKAQQQPAGHVAIVVDHDFVASQDAPWRKVTRTPGQIVSIPSDIPNSIERMHEIHFYNKAFNKVHEQHFASLRQDHT
ncbi:MAG: hypothetical protein LBB16_01410 [Puniceicoccales bacterium]|jgi:hypothetical protein|nr:hypothetical protein [Puniceicoccales bacterium]